MQIDRGFIGDGRPSSAHRIERWRGSGDYQPDAVILDIKLPDMNGYELLKKLKALENLSSTTFIALTGYEQEAVYTNDRHVIFHHFLQKPVNVAYLI